MTLLIKRDGTIEETIWRYNDVTDEGKYVKQDVTNRLPRLLVEEVDLEEGITLREIFTLMNTQLDLLTIILGNWCDSYIEAGLRAPNNPPSYSTEAIEYLELQKFIEISTYEGKPSMYGLDRPQLNGVGYELKEDLFFDWTNEDGSHAIEWPKGSRIPWSLSFTPISDLIDLPVKLNKTFELWSDSTDYDNDKGPGAYSNKKVLELPATQYTVLDIFNGILWELSFFGSPDMKATKLQDLNTIVDDFNKDKS